MGIQFGGIASGMDTNTIVSQLMQIERQPIVQMQSKQQTYQYEKDAWSEINSSLESLKSKVEAMFKDTTFNAVKGTSSNEDAVSIVTSSDSISGTYNIEVTKLASPTYVSSSTNVTNSIYSKTSLGAANTTDTLDTLGSIQDGSITINGQSFTIDADTTTVQNLLDTINGSAAGVTANYDVVNKQFTFTSDVPGNSITFDDNGTGFFSKIGVDEGFYSNGSSINTITSVENSGIQGLVFDGSDNLSFKINGVQFDFAKNSSLNTIIDEINNSEADVTVFYDSSSDKFSITNKTNGDSPIVLEDLNGTNFLTQTNLQGAVQTSGSYASFKVNGVSMTRTSNTFDFNGMELTLKEEGKTSTVNISKDTDAIYNSIKEFVDQYNATLDIVNIRLSEEKSDLLPQKGILRGDSTLVSIKSSLRRLLSSDVTGTGSSFKNLSEIGITTESTDFGKSGKLEIDESKLKDLIKTDEFNLREFFHSDTDSDETVDDGEAGLFAGVYNYVDSLVSTSTKSVNGTTFKLGILPNKMDSIQDIIDDYDDRVEKFEEKLELVQARYWRQFNAMEKALASLNNQSQWLSGQIAGLANFSYQG